MALVEDVLTSNVAKVVAVGAAAAVLPRVVPVLPAPLRGVLKSGLKLFVEAESDAEGGIIDKLADTALQQVLAALSGPGTEGQRHQAARAAVQRYKDLARHRAGRYGHDGADRQARYRRHVAGLQHALAGARRGRSQADQDALQRVSDLAGEA